MPSRPFSDLVGSSLNAIPGMIRTMLASLNRFLLFFPRLTFSLFCHNRSLLLANQADTNVTPFPFPLPGFSRYLMLPRAISHSFLQSSLYRPTSAITLPEQAESLMTTSR